MNFPRMFLAAFSAIVWSLGMPSVSHAQQPNAVAARPASPPAFISHTWQGSAATPTPQQTLTVYSHGDPTAEEQYILEMINRARANPTAEGVRLSNVTDQYVVDDYTYWQSPTRAQVKSDFATYPVMPPLAFNASLVTASRSHSQKMLEVDSMYHNGPDGTPSSRDLAAGYHNTGWSGENVGAYDRDLEEDHDGFQIDFGNPGLQHRINDMNFDPTGPMYKEIGIGIIHGGSGLPHVGPMITTEDFGDAGKSFVVGVVYDDQNHNGMYDVGEGLAGVAITVSGASNTAVTSTSGGYAIPYSGSGTITVTASGGGLVSPISHQIDFNGDNVKVDFTKDYTGLPAQVQLVLPISDTVINVDTAHFSWSAVTGATKYRLQLSTNSTLKTFVLQDSSLAVAKRTFAGLKDSMTYFWRVQAQNAKGWGPFSPIASFTTALVPRVVVLVSPADGTNTGSSDVTFTWQNPNPATVTAYWFELSTSATFATLLRSDSIYDPTMPSEMISGTDFAAGQKYFWRVFAQNDNGWSAPSAVRSITAGTADVAGSAATLSTPATVSPNPSHGEIHFNFGLTTPQDVSLKIFNGIGAEVEAISLGKLAPNEYSIPWNATQHPEGVYFYQLRVGQQTQVGRIVVIR